MFEFGSIGDGSGKSPAGGGTGGAVVEVVVVGTDATVAGTDVVVVAVVVVVVLGEGGGAGNSVVVVVVVVAGGGGAVVVGTGRALTVTVVVAVAVVQFEVSVGVNVAVRVAEPTPTNDSVVPATVATDGSEEVKANVPAVFAVGAAIDCDGSPIVAFTAGNGPNVGTSATVPVTFMLRYVEAQAPAMGDQEPPESFDERLTKAGGGDTAVTGVALLHFHPIVGVVEVRTTK